MSRYFYIGFGGKNNFTNTVSIVGYTYSKEDAHERIQFCDDGYVLECISVEHMSNYPQQDMEPSNEA